MNKIKLLLSVVCVLTLFGCKSVKQPEYVAEKIDYTNEDVINNEIKQIRKLLSSNPLKALFRASFLDNKEVYNECAELIVAKIYEYVDAKDSFSAAAYFNSLKATGYVDSGNAIASKINALKKDVIPGSVVDKAKLPKNITDCINGTVTVWVDKGLKVQNGAGYADIVIGSGFFIDERGYIITNHHVIADLVDPRYEGFSRLYIKFPTDMDTKIPAKVIGYDATVDLALLKAEITPDFVFSLGSSSDLHVGDKISAIGTPIGLEGTLTSGIISNTQRKITILGNVFQIDAAVNSGNSGGPLIDTNYKVQAIVFAGMLQFQGLNFAIPVEYLKQELPLLYNGGEVIHSWIGSYGHTYRVKNQKAGLEVQYVLPGGSAHFAGLKAGDIITEINGKTVNSLEDYQYILMGLSPDVIVECKYLRDEEQGKTIVYLEKRPENPVSVFYNSDYLTDSFIPIYGFKLKSASTSNRKSYRIEKVIKGSIADDLGFSEDDPILIYDVKFDSQNQIIQTQVHIQRKSKGFLDVSLIMPAPFDSPYYF